MKRRGRPRKNRIVKQDPHVSQFSPRGKPGRPDEAYLGIDGFEAIRLTDCLELSQNAAAESMGISQQTFSRILKCARMTIAEAIVKGKIIRIQNCQEDPLSSFARR